MRGIVPPGFFGIRVMFDWESEEPYITMQGNSPGTPKKVEEVINNE